MDIKLNTQKLASMRLAQKKALYKKAKVAYYNQDPIMSDGSFDLLEDDLKNLAPGWSGLKKTGAPVAKNIKHKVKLPVSMFSLDKKKPESVGPWLDKQKGPAVVSLKADGASLELIYKDGLPVQAITRGDGRIGGDVSYLIPHMKIPQKLGRGASVILRCEAIFTAKAFSKYKEVFDAARNAASGLLNRQDVHEAVKDLSIVVLQVLRPNVKLSKGLAWAKSKGFAVIPYKVVNDVSRITPEALVKILESQRSKARFQVDGLVIALDQVNALPTSGNPDWAIAFKTAHVGVVTKVKAVHWDVSHQGYLIPRVEYDPVDWDGSTLTFATAFNAKFIQDNKINRGTKIEIVRSGDIIPFVKKVQIGNNKPALPDQKQFGSWHWDATNTHIVLDAPKDNDDFRVKKLARFFAEMDADFMREKTVRRLYDLGLTNLSKILKAPAEKFVSEGISPQGAQRLHDAIHKAIGQKVPLTKLMNASSTFPRGMGERRFRSLGQTFDLLKLINLSETRQVELISRVPGWNTKTAQAFVAGLPKFIKWLAIVKVPYVNDTGLIKPKKKVNGPLSNINVSWTGYRSKEEEASVEAAGGSVISFGPRTTVLLYSAEGKSSSKVDKAQARGIKVMTWQQFSRKYGL